MWISPSFSDNRRECAFPTNQSALGKIAVEDERTRRIGGAGGERGEPGRHLLARVDDGVTSLGQLEEVAPGPPVAADERALLEMPDERDVGHGTADLGGERHGMPVEQTVDHVRRQPADGCRPVTACVGQLGDVAERHRPDHRVPRGIGRPQPPQAVPALLEGEDALGVVGQLADEEDPQAIDCWRRRRTVAEGPEMGHLVDGVTDARPEPQWMLDVEVRPEGIDAADRLAHESRELTGMVDPLGGHLPARPHATVATHAAPVHPVEVVGHESRPLQPPLRHASMEDLHELRPAIDRIERLAVVVVAHPGHRHDGQASASRIVRSEARWSGKITSSEGR